MKELYDYLKDTPTPNPNVAVTLAEQSCDNEGISDGSLSEGSITSLSVFSEDIITKESEKSEILSGGNDNTIPTTGAVAAIINSMGNIEVVDKIPSDINDMKDGTLYLLKTDIPTQGTSQGTLQLLPGFALYAKSESSLDGPGVGKLVSDYSKNLTAGALSNLNMIKSDILIKSSELTDNKLPQNDDTIPTSGAIQSVVEASQSYIIKEAPISAIQVVTDNKYIIGFGIYVASLKLNVSEFEFNDNIKYCPDYYTYNYSESLESSSTSIDVVLPRAIDCKLTLKTTGNDPSFLYEIVDWELLETIFSQIQIPESNTSTYYKGTYLNIDNDVYYFCGLYLGGLSSSASEIIAQLKPMFDLIMSVTKSAIITYLPIKD